MQKRGFDPRALLSWRLGKRGVAFIIALGLLFFLSRLFEPGDYEHSIPRIPQAINRVWPKYDVNVNVPEQLEMASHYYNENGLLELNPDGPHPLYELIRNAEDVWKTKLERASRTLAEAVAEYQRRYKRDPPIGFDHWWNYVQENNVQLPDEYDSINEGLEWLWGIDPEDLQAQEKTYEAYRTESFVFGKMHMDDPITMLYTTFPEKEVEKLHARAVSRHIAIISKVQQYIPPFRAVFTPNDNPNQAIDYHQLTMALEAARNKRTIKISDMPPVNYTGWVSPCSPDSPARKDGLFDHMLPAQPQTVKTFIYDHKKAMDVCQHPQDLRLHGQFLAHSPAPPVPEKRWAVQFSLCRTMLHRDIAVATNYGWQAKIEGDVAWEEKLDERLLWRGSTTGMYYSEETFWKGSHRSRLVQLANLRQGSTYVLPPTSSDDQSVGVGEELPYNRLNPTEMDIQFAGDVIQCAPDTCEVLAKAFDFRGRMEQEEANLYKYILDVDGNGWSGRYQHLMASSSVIFKSTIYPEWFVDRIQPWVHYVPIQIDYSDIYDVLTFFRGKLDGSDSHDDMARKIGEGGQDWTKRFWRMEDMTAYMFRLYLEYARAMSSDRENMGFKL